MANIPDAPTVAHVYLAIAAVRKKINSLGIAKDREVTDGVRFKFRGIDTVLDSFSGPMAEHDLLMIPSYSDLSIDERPTSKSKTYHVTVTGNYRLISTRDGSEVYIGRFYGEANDTQDKAITKAQSIALRQAYLQTFVVPLGPEADPESGDSTGDGTGYDEKPPIQTKVKERASAPAEGGELKQGQRNILNARLKSKSLVEEDLPEELQPVTTANFNDVIDWIKAQ